MTALFDMMESGFTATAGNLTATVDATQMDFSAWGNPERAKINSALVFANVYYNRRRLGAR